MKILIPLFLTILMSSCAGKRSLATYEVVNFLLVHDNIVDNANLLDQLEAERVYSWERLEFKALDIRITPDDKDYILGQAKDSTSFKLDGAKLVTRPKLIPTEEIKAMLKEKEGLITFWDKEHQKYGGPYYSISKPLFSKNLKIALVSMGYNCGPLCGAGQTYILQKKNGVWEVVGTINTWIS